MIINSYGLQIGVIAMTAINMCLVLKLKEKFDKYKALVNGTHNDFIGSYSKKHNMLFDDQQKVAEEIENVKKDIEELKKPNTEPKYIKVKKAGRPRKNKSAK